MATAAIWGFAFGRPKALYGETWATQLHAMRFLLATLSLLPLLLNLQKPKKSQK